MKHQALERLCAMAGIAGAYSDIWGKSHPVSDRTRAALLGAMGLLRAGDDPQRALAELEARDWGRPLPPVLVVRPADGPPKAPVCLPASAADASIAWELRLESGETRGGSARFGDLPLDASREVDGGRRERRGLQLAADLPLGYHRLSVAGAESAPRAEMLLIIAPADCYRPEAVQDDGRVWGPALQLYALRSLRNWGIGDFTDLRNALEIAARAGAGIVGVNPLHALFPHNPEHSSPYSPSSRNFYNVLYLDVEAVPEFAECDEARAVVANADFQARLRALRAAEMVDYRAVAEVKFPVLETLWAHFRARHLDANSERGRAFRAYWSAGGRPLELYSLFNALQEHFHGADPNVWGWQVWPDAYRDPASPAVSRFLDAHRDRVEFHAWLQWLADAQLQAVGRRSWEMGLGVGVYMDLAVSVDRAGAEAWSLQHAYALDAGVGAPPDDFNLNGQDWGLPPLNPAGLIDEAYEPFIVMLRRNMRHAGALRIDHVMGLMRLFWVPPGGKPADGTYVHYPFHDLLGILALESHRNRCMVIGEDLGTVPDEVRAELGPMGVLSYRLLYFEREHDGGFRPPAHYARQALVAASTHDLPTLKSYWLGHDLDLRAGLGLYPSESVREAQVVARAQDRARLLVALEHESLLPPGASMHPVSAPEMTAELTAALHAYLGRSPSQVMAVQMEDVLGQLEQVNLPGTTDQHPNWKRKLPLNVEEWAADARFVMVTDALRRERGSGAHARVRDASVEPPAAEPVIPRATYRFQFNRDFTFAQAAALVPYLAKLGVSHCYASPFLKARPGSTHGYDIIDHNALNPEIGSDQDFDALCDALRAHGMGLILDLVPNHMGVMGADNGWWLDVLENGPASAHADYFDIDWEPLRASFHGRVVVPVLGDPYGVALERGDLKLAFDAGSGEFSLWYYEHRFPIDPREYPRILLADVERLEQRLGAGNPDALEFRSLATALSHLPSRAETDPGRLAERSRDKEIHKRHLASLAGRSPDVARFIAENLERLDGTAGDPASFDDLHALIEAQAWRLAYWRVASDEINYRRFFDINDLAALRMENAPVFEAAHGLALRLLTEGRLDGLRIDHPDGLHDPLQYFRRLQWRRADLPAAMEASVPRSTYVVVEKILATSEQLPAEWPVHGTTGYDFANLLTGVQVDGSSATRMERGYRAFLREPQPFGELLYRSRRLIMKTALAGELNVLASALLRIAEADRRTSDFTLNLLRDAIREVAACFPVYRTYVTAQGVSEADAEYIRRAVETAKDRSPAADTSVFDFLRDVLLGVAAEGKSDAFRQRVLRFAMKFQQFTAPVMAKGMEDTAFYNHHRLVSLNEVGGDPERYGVSVVAFHHANRERSRQWPHAMLATSTHDSKRSEDVRARLNVLSEAPEEWRRRVAGWQRLNRARKRTVEGHAAPSRNDEYLLYQTLVGAWPLEACNGNGLARLRERVEAYMLKAAREAKAHTSWVNQDKPYEEALTDFVRGVLDAPDSAFVADLREFCAWLAPYGAMNALAQALLKFTCPGVPDLYQGNESWDLSLVDPDNRRPVDYALRARRLDELEQAVGGDVPALTRSLLSEWPDGRLKQWVTLRCLRLRAEHEHLFRDGDYVPLRATGSAADHLIAYARTLGDDVAVTVAARWLAKLSSRRCPPEPEAWGDTGVELPAPGNWVNVLTGETVNARAAEGNAAVPAAELFGILPMGLLVHG